MNSYSDMGKLRFLIGSLGVIIVIFTIPLVITQFSIVDYSSYGPIGDTIGGITSPFVGLLSAYLVYRAFLIQKEANDLLSAERSISIIQYLINETLSSANFDKAIADRKKLAKRLEMIGTIKNGALENAITTFRNSNKPTFELAIELKDVLISNRFKLKDKDISIHSILFIHKIEPLTNESTQVQNHFDSNRQHFEEYVFPREVDDFLKAMSDLKTKYLSNNSV